MNYFWLGLAMMVFGSWIMVRGFKTVRQTNKQFIATREQMAREGAKDEKISEAEAMRKYVDYLRVSTSAWRHYYGGGAFAVGFVLLIAGIALIIGDLYS